MTTYNVFHYVTFHIKKENIEADSPMEAVKKSTEAAWETAYNLGSEWGDIDFSEEQTGALVDVVGDEEHSKTVSFDQKEVYDAKPCNEHG